MAGHQIFISYSSKNSEYAFKTCEEIEKHGYSCWIAPRNEQAGLSYGLQITNAIKEASVVVLLYSAQSNASQHVMNEVGIAFDNDIKIIPLMLDESEMCADMQYFLSRKHYIKAFLNFDAGMAEVIEAIRSSVVLQAPETPKEEEKPADGYEMAVKLTKTLINNSTEMSVAVNRFHDIIKGIPDWTQQERILSKAKEILSYSFIGVIGKDFNKIMAISKEDDPSKCSKFCYACKRIIAITLDLTIFALISRLWDGTSSKTISLDNAEKETIRKRLIMPYQLPIHEQIDLLHSLIQMFKKYDMLQIPIPELMAIQPKLQHDGEIFEACSTLAKIDDKQAKIDECRQAEDVLTVVLSNFNFYMRYHIVSMKWSKYKKNRTNNTKFVHRYVALGLDNKSNVDMEKINLTEAAISTDSVVMYVDQISDKTSINLYPLVIDLNTLYRENGSKICFLYANPMNNSTLEYISLDDGNIITLDNKRIIHKIEDLNELFMSDEDVTIYNIDNVIDTFETMQQSLFGEMYVDFGDL